MSYDLKKRNEDKTIFEDVDFDDWDFSENDKSCKNNKIFCVVNEENAMALDFMIFEIKKNGPHSRITVEAYKMNAYGQKIEACAYYRALPFKNLMDAQSDIKNVFFNDFENKLFEGWTEQPNKIWK